MKLKEINEILFSQAKELKMCDDVHRFWYGKTLSYDELIDLFYHNLDFCIDYRWPDEATIKKFFPALVRNHRGILVSEKWSLLNNTYAVIIGNSEAKARYNGFAVGSIHVFDNSTCEVIAKNHAHVTIHVYDNARITVTADEGTQVLVLRHSKHCWCACVGQATIKECI